ncbi:MAG: SDR family NAD(P)-dependent oxidoreductase, partial [Bacteroidota bacterium]
MADAFVRGGDSVIATSRSVARLRAATNRLNRLGVVEILPCDVRRAGDVSRVARFIQRRHKKIDLLVNNAGVTAFKEFARTSLKEFDEILQSNLRGLFLTTHAILPLMMRRKRGTILNILSYAAKTTYTKSAAYSAAKAGSAAMMNSLRAEV